MQEPLPEQREYHTWISNQLNALAARVTESVNVASDLQSKLKWYKELHQELIKRGEAVPVSGRRLRP